MAMAMENEILICPKCLKPFGRKSSLTNWYGIIPIGNGCRYCDYSGGPVKAKEKDYRKALKNRGVK